MYCIIIGNFFIIIIGLLMINVYMKGIYLVDLYVNVVVIDKWYLYLVNDYVKCF